MPRRPLIALMLTLLAISRLSWFGALEHSTVVILMSVAVVLGARGFVGDSSELSQYGRILSTSASALFPTLIGLGPIRGMDQGLGDDSSVQ